MSPLTLALRRCLLQAHSADFTFGSNWKNLLEFWQERAKVFQSIGWSLQNNDSNGELRDIRGGSGWLDSVGPSLSGAWRIADYAAVRRVVRWS